MRLRRIAFATSGADEAKETVTGAAVGTTGATSSATAFWTARVSASTKAVNIAKNEPASLPAEGYEMHGLQLARERNAKRT